MCPLNLIHLIVFSVIFQMLMQHKIDRNVILYFELHMMHKKVGYRIEILIQTHFIY